MRPFISILVILIAQTAGPVTAQAVLPLSQERDGAPARNLTTAEFNALGDPFFNLVLREHADVIKLSEIENLLKPERQNRHVFVVDENIANSRRGQTRRAVLSFSGKNGEEILTTNVMLSLFFTSEEFSDTPSFIEAWGWDNHRSRYNYYRLDRDGTPDHRMTWKFRGSSVDADLMSINDRRGTCMACHINGAPVMKELPFPWNNWHSFKSESITLNPTNPNRWPVATHPRLKGLIQDGNRAGGLDGAERLEVDGILPAITQFNRRRINSALARRDSDGAIREDQGTSEVVEGQRLLRSLFQTTEFNIVSSAQKSGLHPLSDSAASGPGEPVTLPNSLFLNANLFAGGTKADYLGLKIDKAQRFQLLPKVTAAEYTALVRQSGVRLAGRPGDADFAFLIPEPSHVDNDMIDQLMKRGIVTPQFVAAVQIIDLETPILSESRAKLFRFVPNRFVFRPLKSGDDPFATGRHPDGLTKQIIEAIENSAIASGSEADAFLTLLKNPDPRSELEQRVNQYHERVRTRLEDPAAREAELKRLHNKVIALRRAVLRDSVLQAINETGDRLFPMPDE